LLDQFFERANSARQGDESVGAIEHRPLALMHIASDDQLLTEPSRPLALGEEVRDNSGSPAAMRQDSVGQYAHQPNRAAAIYKTHVIFGKDSTESAGSFAEDRLCPRIRSAIDADRIDFVHGLILMKGIHVASILAICKRFLPGGVAHDAPTKRGLC
jgi:hypothetical protein